MSDCVHHCPCGNFGDPQKACGCAPAVVTKYQKRISAPLLDRIDIHIEVPHVDYEKRSGDRMGIRRNLFEPEYKLHTIFTLSVFQRLVKLLRAVGALSETSKSSMTPRERVEHDHEVASLRAGMDEKDFILLRSGQREGL